MHAVVHLLYNWCDASRGAVRRVLDVAPERTAGEGAAGVEVKGRSGGEVGEGLGRVGGRVKADREREGKGVI